MTHNRTGQIGAVQGCAAEIRGGQVAIRQVLAGQIDPCQIRLNEGGGGEVGLYGVFDLTEGAAIVFRVGAGSDASQISAGEVGANESGAVCHRQA